MRLPRDVSGQRLADALGVLGYVSTRQRGDHLRLTTQQNGEHHISIPLHNSLRIGTLADILAADILAADILAADILAADILAADILADVASHHHVTRDELLLQLGL